MPKPTTLADIEKSYDDAITKAKDAEVKMTLQAERAAAVAEFKLRAVAEREKALWTREALAEYPLAREFVDRVTGDTEDAIRESARALHERIEKLFGEHQKKLEIDRIIQEHLNGGSTREAPEGDAEPVEAV